MKIVYQKNPNLVKNINRMNKNIEKIKSFPREMREKMEIFFCNLRSAMEIFFCNLRSAIEFFKFGWSDRDYDYSYLYRLIHFKLKKMKKCLMEFETSEDNPRIQSINECICALERLQADQYDTNIKKHEEKWGERIFYIDEDNFLRSTLEDAIGEERYAIMKKEGLKAHKADAKLREKDISLLFDTIKKHHLSWWI